MKTPYLFDLTGLCLSERSGRCRCLSVPVFIGRSFALSFVALSAGLRLPGGFLGLGLFLFVLGRRRYGTVASIVIAFVSVVFAFTEI